MDPRPFLDRITDDEGLTAGLDEERAMLMIRALADHVRALADNARDSSDLSRRVESLCRRARQACDVIRALSDVGEPEARRIATRHGFTWPSGRDPFPGLIAQLDRPGR